MAAKMTVDWRGDVIVIIWCGCVGLGFCMSWVAISTVKRGVVAPMMEGSINDTGEEPLCQCRRVRQNCPCHGCFPAKKSNLNLMFPSALKRFRRHLLAVPAGCDVCCTLQCASGRVWGPIRRPDNRSTVNALVAQVWDFIPTVGSWESRSSSYARHQLSDEAPGYLKRVKVTLAVYWSFSEFIPLRFRKVDRNHSVWQKKCACECECLVSVKPCVVYVYVASLVRCCVSCYGVSCV